ncbi:MULTISPECIES: outer membrane protein [Kordiimonas]|uniref:outer membrane protein n=1 Tax=Kordiimonas TaxID=288021 RepID=UPI00257FBC6D|nr:outer membrane beta-barrel protein [Kordiimonas sp. UBA4487]
MKLFLTTAAILAAATTAHADDTKHFDGGYIAGEGGYLTGDGPDGAYYGGFAGFRWQDNNNFVFGLEGSFGTTSVGTYYDESDSEDFYKSQWTALATVGYANGRNLFVVGGGYARANSSYVYGGESTDVSYGAFAGMVGYEHAFDDLISLRARVVTYEFKQFIPSLGFVFRF